MGYIDALVEKIDKIRRTPVVAQIGGFRPPDHITSQFGGRFAISEKDWPIINGSPGIPLIQIIINELPFRPEWAGDIEMIQIFLDSESLPQDLPAENGNGFAVVETLSVGQDLWVPDGFKDWPREFPIKWFNGDLEAPVWEDLFNYFDFSEIGMAVDEEDGFDFYHDRYEICYSTKIGGYPSYCQSATGLSKEFVLQISSEEKPQFMVGDSGNLYFYKHEGSWYCDWDCY